MTEDSQIDLRDSAIGGAVRRKKQIEIHNILYTEENANQLYQGKLHSMLVTPIIFKMKLSAFSILTPTKCVRVTKNHCPRPRPRCHDTRKRSPLRENFRSEEIRKMKNSPPSVLSRNCSCKSQPMTVIKLLSNPRFKISR